MRYSVETRLRPGQVYARAREFFGPGGRVGLQLTENTPNRLSFVGGGGYVIISAHRAWERTAVNLEVWQFDAEAREFLASLPGPAGALRRAWNAWQAHRR